MNYNNTNGTTFNSISFPTTSWGSFSSRYDRQPNNKNSGNIALSNLNKQENVAGDFSSQNQSNFGTSNDFKNSAVADAGGVFFNTNQSNSNGYEFSSEFCGNQRNNRDGYQQNLNNFGTEPALGNDNSYTPQQNRWNRNNPGQRKFQSNKMNNFKNQSFSWPSGSGNGSYDNGNDQKNQNNANNSNYVSFRKFRQHFSNRQDDSSNNVTSAPSLFMGRDQSYPDELNALMNPFFCGVCNSRLNSIKSANIHYESKAHDKHITNWLKKHFAEKGLAVPEIKRFVTEEAIGPYRCELCKVDLTSAQHALQHYNGKRHKQAASKISPPTGIGYYNVDGNWVETGKVLDKVTGKETSYILVNTPSGFEPVVLHVAPNTVAGVKRPAELNVNNAGEPLIKKPNPETQPRDAEKEKIKTIKEEQYRTMISDYEKNKQQQNTSSPGTNSQFKTVSLDSEKSCNNNQTPQEALNSQQCKICGIATTSYDQMILHLKGIRHTKKLRALGEPPIADLFDKSPTTILASLDNNDPSDVSMYRTPSGSYYCKPCDVALEDIGRIKKHISSKVHLTATKAIEKSTKGRE